MAREAYTYRDARDVMTAMLVHLNKIILNKFFCKVHQYGRENWKNSKLCGNTPPCGRRVSTQFLVFPIATRFDITVYQYGKCFIFLKYQ